MVYADETKKLNWLFAVKQLKNNDKLPDSECQKYLSDAKKIETDFVNIISKNKGDVKKAGQIYEHFNADVFLLMQEVARGNMSNDAGKSAFDKINRKYDNMLIKVIKEMI